MFSVNKKSPSIVEESKTCYVDVARGLEQRGLPSPLYI